MQLHYPWKFDPSGHTSTCGEDEHLREQIEQMVFTAPGERVNRPDFGAGAMQNVFEGNSQQLTARLQVDFQASLERGLSDRLVVERLEVTNVNAELHVDLDYSPLRTGDRRNETFKRENVA